MAVAALVVSLVALVNSIGWAIYTWRRSGELLSVVSDLRPPLLHTFGHRRRRTGMIGPAGLTVTAINRGRTAARVHQLFVVDTDGGRSKVTRRERSAALPTTIEARDRVTWYIDPQTFGVFTKRRTNPLVVRPMIEYGPGKMKRGRKLRIGVPAEYLPGLGKPFTPTFIYRLRTFRKTQSWDVIAVPGIVTTSAPDGGATDPPS